MSGFCRRSLQSATRLLSPPESILTGVMPGGQRRASMAISRRESRSQASRASSFSCTSPWRSISLLISSSDIGSANFSLIRLYSFSASTVSFTASSTISRTVLSSSSSGSCSRKPTVWPGERTVSPLNSFSFPARMRSRELFPDPLRPMTPIFAP